MARQRDARGRFIKGHSGGPGRPSKTREVEYWTIAQTTCSFDDWRAIIAQAVADAKAGDTAARAWLTSIVVGDPHKLRERADAADTQAASIETPGDVVTLLARELADVSKFESDPRRAAAVSRLADGLLRAFETTDLAQQLARIKALLSGGKDDDQSNELDCCVLASSGVSYRYGQMLFGE